MDEGKLMEAYALVNHELSMPYIPTEAEEELKSLEKELRLEMAQSRSFDLNKLDKWLLEGNDEQQLGAVNALCGMNLRNHLDLISEYFSKERYPNAVCLLIDALIEQDINEEVHILKDGLEIEFVPRYVERPFECDGFVEGNELLKEWFGNDNPSLYQLCAETLVHECYLFLPLTYESEDAYQLAYSIAATIMSAMEGEEAFERWTLAKNIKKVPIMPLKSLNN